jgi:hypothetical protein
MPSVPVQYSMSCTKAYGCVVKTSDRKRNTDCHFYHNHTFWKVKYFTPSVVYLSNQSSVNMGIYIIIRLQLRAWRIFTYHGILLYNAHLWQECHNSKFGIFWAIGIERNVCRCTFNRYSVITQFAKLAAGEQLCQWCTHRKLEHFKTFGSLSWKNHTFWVVTLLSQMSDIEH